MSFFEVICCPPLAGWVWANSRKKIHLSQLRYSRPEDHISSSRQNKVYSKERKCLGISNDRPVIITTEQTCKIVGRSRPHGTQGCSFVFSSSVWACYIAIKVAMVKSAWSIWSQSIAVEKVWGWKRARPGTAGLRLYSEFRQTSTTSPSLDESWHHVEIFC